MNSIIITSLYFTKFQALAVGIVVCGTGVGTVAFALGGNSLLKIIDWRKVILVEAVIAASMSLVSISFKPLKPIRIVTSQNIPQNEIATSQTQRLPKKHSKDASYYVQGPSVDVKRRKSSWVTEGHIYEGMGQPNVVVNKHRSLMSRCCDTIFPCCCKRDDKIMMIHPLLKEEIFKESKDQVRKYSINSSTSTTIRNGLLWTYLILYVGNLSDAF